MTCRLSVWSGTSAGAPIPSRADGARAAKPDVVLLTDYSWDFVNQGMCNALALDQIARGSDVVFNVAGACGTGALTAAASKGVWGIGVDVDQSYLGDHILTSAVKNVDQAVFQTIQMIVDGRTHGGTITFGFAEKGVGLGTISTAVPRTGVVDAPSAWMSAAEVEALHCRYCRAIGVEPNRLGITIEIPEAEYAEMIQLAAAADEADREYAAVLAALGAETDG